MPTTNISQIISDVIDSVRFFRIEQRRFVTEYSGALFLSSYKNTKRMANFCSSSQSSISRLLSSQSLSTRDLSYGRVEYISRFLQKNSLEFKYIILDETVMKRRGKRIGNLGKFYSTIENRIVSGVSLERYRLGERQTLLSSLLVFERRRESHRPVRSADGENSLQRYYSSSPSLL